MLRYFKPTNKTKPQGQAALLTPPLESHLPDPNTRPTFESAACCAAANAGIMEVMATAPPGQKRKRTNYRRYDEELCLKIARYAVDNGPAKAARHFKAELGHTVNESTVCPIKKQYNQQVKLRAANGDAPDTIQSLPKDYRGRPAMLPHELDKEVQHQLRDI